jgi:hypothetical protein
MTEEWRPGWLPGDFGAMGAKVSLLLRRGTYAGRLGEAEQRFKGTTWWSRQFDITARAAHASYHTNLGHIDRLAKDAPRVLRLIHDDWEGYMDRVHAARGQSVAGAVEHEARKGPGELYVFIVTKLLQQPWRSGGHQAGMEESSLSIWRKIGRDCQYLWPFPEFKALMGW